MYSFTSSKLIYLKPTQSSLFESRQSTLAEHNQSNYSFESSDIERLKTRFADIIYRHALKKAARMHLETICDKAIQNKTIAIEKYNAQKNELQKLRKVCSESTTIRRTLENRVKNYSQTRKHLKYQLNMERRSRQSFERHVIILANSLKLMSRLLQVQLSSGIENLPHWVQLDIEPLKSRSTLLKSTHGLL